MVVNQQHRVRLDTSSLERFARRVARAMRLPLDGFSVALVSDRRIAGLNRRYRRRARPTDVLSFPLSGNGRRNGYAGDIVISAETARRNARELGHSTAEEIKLLILHGALHLRGYDHETDNGRMNRREHQLRRRLGLE